ncbi:MAG TPA: serine hydrolase [Steroidobacteraceae bacterium]|nr:serine hydrolase [Steroidobacteraceae bacterium]
MRGIKSVLYVSAVFVLAACGGGGGGGGGNNPPPAPPATNTAPSVNAGADQTATLPNATVSLSGSATDDGPASSLTYQWSASPATGVTFSAATAAATNATFTTAGAYTLTLTVGDGTLTGTDTVAVTVNDVPATTDVWPADDDDSDATFHGWAKVDAATVGMTQAGLDTAATFAQNVPDTVVKDPVIPGKEPGNGMIVRHGQLVHFWGDIDEKLEVKSVTKSMGGIVLGLAFDEDNAILTKKGVDFIPTFGTPPDANAANGADTITLAQLATHTAGFDKDGGFVALQFPPGTHWRYSDGGLNWLADVLTTRYQQDLSALAQDRVWKKVGLNNLGTNTDDVFWRPASKRPATRNGGTLQYRELASGIQTNVNAMARIGLLFLRKGMWKDQRVLSEAFVTQAHTPLPENASLELFEPTGEHFPGALTDYGVLWWTNKSGIMANVPKDAFFAWGLGEALIVVIPSLDLVIARNGGQDSANSTGRIWNDNDWDGDVHVLEGFLNPIVAATTP